MEWKPKDKSWQRSATQDAVMEAIETLVMCLPEEPDVDERLMRDEEAAIKHFIERVGRMPHTGADEVDAVKAGRKALRMLAEDRLGRDADAFYAVFLDHWNRTHPRRRDNPIFLSEFAPRLRWPEDRVRAAAQHLVNNGVLRVSLATGPERFALLLSDKAYTQATREGRIGPAED